MAAAAAATTEDAIAAGTLRVIYFAWLRERVGLAEEQVPVSAGIATVGDLLALLRARSRADVTAAAKVTASCSAPGASPAPMVELREQLASSLAPSVAALDFIRCALRASVSELAAARFAVDLLRLGVELLEEQPHDPQQRVGATPRSSRSESSAARSMAPCAAPPEPAAAGSVCAPATSTGPAAPTRSALACPRAARLVSIECSTLAPGEGRERDGLGDEYSSMPASRQRSRSSRMALAVTATIGVRARPSCSSTRISRAAV